MRRMLTAVALCGTTAAVSSASAACQDVSGSWNVTWAQAVRNNRDGTQEIQKWGDATLSLHQEGERVYGEWTQTVLERVTWKVEGTLVGDRLTLSATDHDSTNPQLAQVQEMRWRATLASDRLDGEMTLVFRGAQRSRPWRPWRATRAGPG